MFVVSTSSDAAGTTLVKDIFPGATYYYNGAPPGSYIPNSSNPANLTNVNGILFFTAEDGIHGPELWQSDGAAAGTIIVADISPGSAGSNPSNLTAVSGTLFFSADDGIHGNELWKLVDDGQGQASLALSGFPATVTAGVLITSRTR